MAKSRLAVIEGPRDGAPRTGEVQSAAVERVAHGVIRLSQLAPRLGELAATRQSESDDEAARAKEVAALARRMTATLGHSLGLLRTASSEIAELTQLIRRISDETSLIAVNAGVAAARAGDEGRVFAVLAQQIRTLSENAAGAARDVETRIRKVQDSAELAGRVAGFHGASEAGGTEAVGLAWLLERTVEAEGSAARQAQEARELGALGLGVRQLAEEMIRCVGAFRLDAHRRAEALVERLRTDPGLCSGDEIRQARALRMSLLECPFVELAYATDLRGIQLFGNVAKGSSFNARYGDSGTGKDWSRRPWFQGALRGSGVHSSEIYRSAATDEFCLTVCATFGPAGAAPLGVVALDVDFRQLLGAA